MIIFPAIDIKDGKCVRLLKGDFNKITSYEKSPLEQANFFSKKGFKNIHIIDLDGALLGESKNTKIIREIINNVKLKIQIGGGIRNIDNINSWIEAGVDRIVMGTAAVENISLLKNVCEKFKNKIAIALDVRDGLIALSGWTKQTNISALDFVNEVKDFGISRIIYTDIEKDGTKKGPNIKDTVDFAEKVNIPIVISGGISSINDIKKIKSLNNSTIEGIIVGKSIYDGDIEINDLVKII